jgi:hypothetical protein
VDWATFILGDFCTNASGHPDIWLSHVTFVVVVKQQDGNKTLKLKKLLFQYKLEFENRPVRISNHSPSL